MSKAHLSTSTWMSCCIIFTISLYISTHVYISWDSSWLLEAARRFVAGGTYSADFVEPNPPLILYLYSLAILLSKALGHIIASFILLVYVITFTSLALCYQILKEFIEQHAQIVKLIIVSLCFGELLLPCSDFGQREHLSILFITPYLFLAATRLATRPCNFTKSILCGLMAGIGFAIKPHFVLPWLIVMLFMAYQKRSFRVIFLIENISIALLMLGYVVAALLLNPDYFQFILPLDYHYYLNYWHTPLILLLTDPLTLFILYCLITTFLQFRNEPTDYRFILQALFLANLSYLVLYFMQKQDWYYHLLPSLILSTTCLTLNINEAIQKISNYKNFQITRYIQLILGILMASFLLAFCSVWNLAHLTQRTDPNDSINQFLTELRSINQGPFLVISTSMEPNGSLISYSGLQSAGRFPGLWLLSGSLKFQNQPDSQSQKLAHKGLNLTRHILVEDILRDPPFIILIDDNPTKKYFGEYAFDYVKFMKEDPCFKELWSYYRLKNRINNYTIYIRTSNFIEPTKLSNCRKIYLSSSVRSHGSMQALYK